MYLKKTDVGKPAEAGWQLFWEQWEDDYAPTETALALIMANPKKQVVDEGGILGFKPLAYNHDASELEKIVTLCQTVRNNLFHGGKTSKDGWDDFDRTKLLRTLVLVVLGELAHGCHLNHDYTGYY